MDPCWKFPFLSLMDIDTFPLALTKCWTFFADWVTTSTVGDASHTVRWYDNGIFKSSVVSVTQVQQSVQLVSNQQFCIILLSKLLFVVANPGSQARIVLAWRFSLLGIRVSYFRQLDIQSDSTLVYFTFDIGTQVRSSPSPTSPHP